MKNQTPTYKLRLNKLNLSYKITKEPYMIGNDLWWFVIENIDGYVLDIYATSKELFELYGELTNLEYDDFISKAKAKELDLKMINLK